MGASISKALSPLFTTQKQDLRLLILGLHAVGKTAFLYKLKLGDIVTTIPTIGLNVESITYENLTFTMWDSGGSCGLRRQWCHFYQDTAGIIFVVDSNDRDRISEAREDLHRMSNEDTLCDAVFLIIANKQDIPGYMTVMEVYEALRLDQLAKIGKQRVHIQPCTVLQRPRDGARNGMAFETAREGLRDFASL